MSVGFFLVFLSVYTYLESIFGKASDTLTCISGNIVILITTFHC